jgi:DNA primase
LTDDWVKQVKEANDIVDVVGGYLALRPAGATFKGLCPFHDDNRPSFDVDPRRQRYRCWACGKYGDVIAFVQEHDRVDFREALDLLARRAGIKRENSDPSPQNQGRALMLEAVRWAADQFHQCLLDTKSPTADAARVYLGQRGLLDETIRRYGLGFAPPMGQWLVQRAEANQVSLEVLEKVGLIARRTEGSGFYDRFRDRVQFPIRDVRGQVVGFGGRILPSSPFASRGPKYYNSSETALFNKSELLYGLDAARNAAVSSKYLAVVEGYTDVLMAHQMGVLPVVATMGTALNAKHVQNLRRFVSRVVLVFDADAGGETGVDRALEVFASHDLDLAVATLPEGLDPCDLLLEQGPEAFRKILESAVDALEFKLSRVLAGQGPLSVEGQRRAVDAVLGVIAFAPPLTGQAGAVKTELMISRIARRLVLKEETVWARLEELRQKRRGPDKGAIRQPEAAPAAPRAARAAPEERELLEVLLANPDLVPLALAEIPASQIEHPGLLRLLEGLYDLQRAGQPATLDQLRARLDGPLTEHAFKLQDVGGRHPDPAGWLNCLLGRFRERRLRTVKEELHNQLHAASDHSTALELLRQLQNRNDVRAG